MSDNKPVTFFISYFHDKFILAIKVAHCYDGRDGVRIIMDDHDLPYGGSIRKFMESARDSDFLVAIISDGYLKSLSCMYEISQMMDEKDYENRILPAVVEPDIYNGKRCYIRYWRKQLKEARAHRDDMTETDFEMTEKVGASAKRIIEFLTDRKNPTLEGAITILGEILKKRGGKERGVLMEILSRILPNERIGEMLNGCWIGLKGQGAAEGPEGKFELRMAKISAQLSNAQVWSNTATIMITASADWEVYRDEHFVTNVPLAHNGKTFNFIQQPTGEWRYVFPRNNRSKITFCLTSTTTAKVTEEGNFVHGNSIYPYKVTYTMVKQ